jgi:hypothetical protein
MRLIQTLGTISVSFRDTLCAIAASLSDLVAF